MKRYKAVIRKALDQISEAQHTDGSFASFSSIHKNDFSDAIPRSTTFFTASIVLSLQNAKLYLTPLTSAREQHILQNIEDKAIKFLLSQKSEQWSFNYWSQGTKEMMTLPYPDDLDDTFSALAAIAQYDPNILDGKALATILEILISSEIAQGGPYKTWLTRNNLGSVWGDVDIAVNSTIGYFLSFLGIHLPNLEHLINDAVEKSTITSPYYDGPLPVSYFISRYYQRLHNKNDVSIQKDLADIIAKKLGTSSELLSPLDQSMAISSLIMLGFSQKISSSMITTLLDALEYYGFHAHPFCIDPALEQQRCYAGAPALTAAFCIEALALSSNAIACKEAPPTKEEKKDIHEYICSLARTQCMEIGEDLRCAALQQIKKTSDKKITAVAYEFQNVLRMKGKNVPEHIVEKLSLANLYGWMAYTMYDDILDADTDAALLPCANFFLRKIAGIYNTLDRDIHGSYDMFEDLLDHIDNANIWEQNNCRISIRTQNISWYVIPPFGEHKNLAERSIGHALGPLTLLLSIGCAPRSKEYHHTAWFFRHYLIARQLHDDAHDWSHDLLHDRVNSVGAMVIRRFQEKNRSPSHARTVIEIMPELQKIFWEEIIDEVAALIHFHIITARNAREGSDLLAHTEFMENTLHGLELSARKALKERNNVIIFLKYYKHNQASGFGAKNPLI